MSNILKINVLIRRETVFYHAGYHKWFTGFGGGLIGILKNCSLPDISLSTYHVNVAWSRLNRNISTTDFSPASISCVDLGWGNELTFGSMCRHPRYQPPIHYSWVGFPGLCDRLQIEPALPVLQNRVRTGIDLYNKRRQKRICSPCRLGCRVVIYPALEKTGLEVNNKGIDVL